MGGGSSVTCPFCIQRKSCAHGWDMGLNPGKGYFTPRQMTKLELGLRVLFAMNLENGIGSPYYLEEILERAA